jgi:hypothetical protein
MYNKLLVVFHTGTRNIQINLYFPKSEIPPFSFDIDSYNDTLNHQIREVERPQFKQADYFDDNTYKRIIYNFNLFTNDEMKITPSTRVKNIIICFLHNPDVIALWISFILMFSIISFLFNKNDQERYISKDIELNLQKFNSIHDLPNFFNNLSSCSSSSSSSSSETVNE